MIEAIFLCLILPLGVLWVWAGNRAYDAEQSHKAGIYTRTRQGYDR